MAKTPGRKTGDDDGLQTQHEDAAPGPAPSRRSPLLPVIGVIAALLIGFLIFVATRSAPNYQEEQFTPDPVEETT